MSVTTTRIVNSKKPFVLFLVYAIAISSLVTLWLALDNSNNPTSGRRFLSSSSTENNHSSEECIGVFQPPNHYMPDDKDWLNTLVVGFPSGDKRLVVFVQFEGLTGGWAARDELFGMTNNPFLIKSNYLHYNGVWGWDDTAEQVVMVARNVRRTLTEFHDIMWDLQFPSDDIEALANKDRLFGTIPPQEIFLEWRDDRVMGEIRWYGW